MNIQKVLRLDATQYYQDRVPKRQIYLHHTVGGSAKSTFDYWNKTPERVGTAYIVERDGTIFEVFPPAYWAHHLGLKEAHNRRVNMESIGIELASEGALRLGYALNAICKRNFVPARLEDDYLYAFDIQEGEKGKEAEWFKRAKRLYHIKDDESKFYEHHTGFRGYTFFDRYDPPQVHATLMLVDQLCTEFEIPKRLIPGDRFRYDPLLATDFEGILTHCNVRADKSDLCPAWPWQTLEEWLNA